MLLNVLKMLVLMVSKSMVQMVISLISFYNLYPTQETMTMVEVKKTDFDYGEKFLILFALYFHLLQLVLEFLRMVHLMAWVLRITLKPSVMLLVN